MANTPSAKKMVRKIDARTLVNKSRRSRMRSFLVKVEQAIASGDAAVAADSFKKAEPEVARAAQKGVIHRRTASRKLSRMAKRIKSLALAKTA